MQYNMKHMKAFEFFNWGKKNKKTPKEKADDLHAIVVEAWNRLVKEAGGEEGLRVGKEMGYDNFGDFTDYCYEFGNDIQKIIIEDKGNAKYYKSLIVDIHKRMLKITHIRRVSELSVSQFKAARSKLEFILKIMKNV